VQRASVSSVPARACRFHLRMQSASNSDGNTQSVAFGSAAGVTRPSSEPHRSGRLLNCPWASTIPSSLDRFPRCPGGYKFYHSSLVEVAMSKTRASGSLGIPMAIGFVPSQRFGGRHVDAREVRSPSSRYRSIPHALSFRHNILSCPMAAISMANCDDPLGAVQRDSRLDSGVATNVLCHFPVHAQDRISGPTNRDLLFALRVLCPSDASRSSRQWRCNPCE